MKKTIPDSIKLRKCFKLKIFNRMPYETGNLFFDDCWKFKYGVYTFKWKKEKCGNEKDVKRMKNKRSEVEETSDRNEKIEREMEKEWEWDVKLKMSWSISSHAKTFCADNHQRCSVSSGNIQVIKNGLTFQSE